MASGPSAAAPGAEEDQGGRSKELSQHLRSPPLGPSVLTSTSNITKTDGIAHWLMTTSINMRREVLIVTGDSLSMLQN